MRENEEIRRIRQANDWSLETAAKKIGTSADQLSKLERGERKLTVTWLNRILPAYGMTTAEFYGGSEHEKEGGLREPAKTSFHGAKRMPIMPELIAKAGAMAYMLTNDIEKSSRIGVKAAENVWKDGGNIITEHIIQHYIDLEERKPN